MGHYVDYIVDMGLEEVLLHVDADTRRAYLALPEQDKNGLFEGVLPGTSFGLIFECGSVATVACYAAVKYSWLVGQYADHCKAIASLDEAMAGWLASGTIYRCDELLVEDWEMRHGSQWRDDPNGFERLCSWLAECDPIHWLKVS